MKTRIEKNLRTEITQYIAEVIVCVGPWVWRWSDRTDESC